ncbi:hypothetical protein AVEN_95889-1 [Araneus ventricosus]|uniref:Uncharacterized protein n=1 Tax=Araneus ventricosus TaxID=182803 RepID=A0A4Y2Q4L2_ARAVE|nr:hypothetical protein AVEN_95889-1 [Araneus ventricosus]
MKKFLSLLSHLIRSLEMWNQLLLTLLILITLTFYYPFQRTFVGTPSSQRTQLCQLTFLCIFSRHFERYAPTLTPLISHCWSSRCIRLGWTTQLFQIRPFMQMQLILHLSIILIYCFIQIEVLSYHPNLKRPGRILRGAPAERHFLFELASSLMSFSQISPVSVRDEEIEVTLRELWFLKEGKGVLNTLWPKDCLVGIHPGTLTLFSALLVH